MTYTFTQDFNVGAGSYTNIEFLVKTFGIPSTIIEVGVFEGSTTFWMSDRLSGFDPKFKIYAIDPHVGSPDIKCDDFSPIKNNFLKNLEYNSHKNVEYIPKFSSDALLDLINAGVKAQLIYIDGDHTASTVLSDLVLAWRCLELGGVILCDDTNSWRYYDEKGFPAIQMSPRMAVESFIWCNYHKVEPLRIPDSSQTAFRKIKE